MFSKERRKTRNTIQIISRHQRLSAQDTQALFKKENIYANNASWAKFIDILLLCAGVAFMIVGAILFFAYNWDDLHKFVKLGIIQLLIVSGIGAVFIFRQNQLVRNILLMATSMLVGLLFSIFGQIYQTGADAYDFFLGWTVFVMLWAVVSDFAPLWLLCVLLVNITFSLYVSQTGPSWTAGTTYLILSVINLAAIILVMSLASKDYITPVPGWFEKILVVMAISCITISLVAGIFDKYQAEWFVALVIGIIAYAGGIAYALRHKSIYLLCLIPLSTIIVLTALVLEVFVIRNEFLYLLVGLVIVASISLLVNILFKLNKAWYGGG